LDERGVGDVALILGMCRELGGLIPRGLSLRPSCGGCGVCAGPRRGVRSSGKRRGVCTHLSWNGRPSCRQASSWPSILLSRFGWSRWAGRRPRPH